MQPPAWLTRGTLLSLTFWIVFLGGVRFAVVPPESCGIEDEDQILLAAQRSAAWMSRNQYDDGSYVYLYYKDTDTIPRDYNEVRHAGVTMSLYQAAGRLGDRDALAAADRAVGWMEDNLVRRHDWAALAYGGRLDRPPLGASALMVISLAERRLATADDQYDDLMHEVGNYMTTLQRPDGGFHIGWDVQADAPDTYGTSRYYPGEALWALALMHEAFPGEGWDDHAWATLRFITEDRDEVEGVEFPPLPDQWASYGLAEMVEWGLSDFQIDYARRLAGRFGLLIRTESQREGSAWGTTVRGREARASGIGTWAEGMAGLWRVAAQDKRLADIKNKAEKRLHCVAGILAERQYTPEEAAEYPRPGIVEGAWFINEETRMDDMQHAFSGIIYALDALDALAEHTVRAPEEPIR
ncbi:MAG TPA: hypothetical protein VMR52_12425 [Dehalococcoidia bacterium]|nr:hypothetical protein [Dehalococcoidia bacterium]